MYTSEKIMNRNLAFLVSVSAMLIFTEWNAAIAGRIDITAYSTGASTPWYSQSPTLINTAGNVNAGVPDTHWQVRRDPGTNATAYAVSNLYMQTTKGYLIIQDSQWITVGNPVADQTAGIFVYSTSFSFPANYTSPITIEGSYLSDNGIQEIRYNGAKILGPYPGSTSQKQLFSTKTQAKPGNNTLEFFVNNQTNSFTGLDIQFTKVQAIPEPSTYLLSICGAGIAIVIRLLSLRYGSATGLVKRG
jgi:hypothetical protein